MASLFGSLSQPLKTILEVDISTTLFLYDFECHLKFSLNNVKSFEYDKQEHQFTT